MSQSYHTKPELSTDSSESGFFAVLPCDLLYDDSVSSSAKLLYAAISGMTREHGYCYATNEYLAAENRMHCSADSVSRWIRELTEHGYIRVLFAPQKGRPPMRQIYTSLSSYMCADCGQDLGKNADLPRQKCRPTSAKMPTSNKGISNINKINKCKASLDASQCVDIFRGYIQRSMDLWRAGELPNAWDGKPAPIWSETDLAAVLEDFRLFAEMRCDELHKPLTRTGIHRICAKLVNLSGGSPQLMAAMLKDAKSNLWLSVYEPHRPKQSPPKDSGGDVEWL